MARQCGSCTLCCTLHGVNEGMPDGKPKPPNTRCQYLGDRGCSIYETRPQECRDYTCLWIEGHGDKLIRPNRTGVMFETQDVDGEQWIVARTVKRGKETGRRVRQFIEALKRAATHRIVFLHPDMVRRDGFTEVQFTDNGRQMP